MARALVSLLPRGMSLPWSPGWRWDNVRHSVMGGWGGVARMGLLVQSGPFHWDFLLQFSVDRGCGGAQALILGISGSF